MDMALDDVIAKNRRGGGGGGRGRGRGGGGSFGYARGSFSTRSAKSARGVRKTPLKAFKVKRVAMLTKRGRRRGGLTAAGTQAKQLLEASNKLKAEALKLMRQRNSRGGGRMIRQAGRIPDGVWTRGGGFGAGGAGRLAMTTKIQISNLDFGVSDDDIRELFGEFGAVRKSMVHYDLSGRSQGTAEVIYERRADAMKAIQQYNGMPLDGRPMKIEIVGGGGGGDFVPSLRRPRGEYNDAPSRRGRGGRGGMRGGMREKKPAVTSEDLDKELDAYISKN